MPCFLECTVNACFMEDFPETSLRRPRFMRLETTQFGVLGPQLFREQQAIESLRLITFCCCCHEYFGVLFLGLKVARG